MKLRKTAPGTAFAVLAAAAGCAQFQPPAGSAPREAVEDEGCEAGAAIANAEGGDDRVLPRAGRGGYVYTYADERGSTVSPAGSFTPSRDSAGRSRYALRFQGQLAQHNDVYAGLGLSFLEPRGSYDGSRYQGLAFMARKSPESIAALRLKVADAGTDPAAGTCTECYNDFGVSFQVTDEWTRYVIAFADMKQEQGWGAPRAEAIDTAKLYGIQWQVTTSGARFDVWIDDVTFTGCP